MGAVATPDELVVTLAFPVKVAPAPVVGAVNVTLTPLTGLPKLSFTVAWRAVAKTALINVPCGVPAVAVMDAAGPGVLVRLKGAFTEPTEAVTVYEPATVLAVAVTLATPEEFVDAVLVQVAADHDFGLGMAGIVENAADLAG